MLIFTFIKVWKFLIKNQMIHKVKSEKDKGIKVLSLMPIRVNTKMTCVGLGARISSTQTEQWLPRRAGRQADKALT